MFVIATDMAAVFFVRHAITNIVQNETRSKKSGKAGSNRQMGEARIIHRISNHNCILVQRPGIRAGADDLYDMVCNLPAYYRYPGRERR